MGRVEDYSLEELLEFQLEINGFLIAERLIKDETISIKRNGERLFITSDKDGKEVTVEQHHINKGENNGRIST